jgi:hypothetical protein
LCLQQVLLWLLLCWLLRWLLRRLLVQLMLLWLSRSANDGLCTECPWVPEPLQIIPVLLACWR